MGKKKRGRRKLAVLSVFALLLALVAGLVVLPTPSGYEVEPPNLIDQTLAGWNLYHMIKKSKPGEVCEITLSPELVDSILRTAQFACLVKKYSGGPLPYRISYNGNFHGAVLLPPKGGKWVELSATAQVTADATTEKITVRALRAGLLPLPAFLGRKAAEKALAKLRRNGYYQELRPGIKSMKTLPDGSLKVSFEPYFYKKFEKQLKDFIFCK